MVLEPVKRRIDEFSAKSRGSAFRSCGGLIELAVSIYFANRNPGEFASVFFLMFFSLLIPTLILAYFVIKGLRSKEPDVKPTN